MMSYKIGAVFSFDSNDSYNKTLLSVHEVAGEQTVDTVLHEPEEPTDLPLFEVVYELPTEAEAYQLSEKLAKVEGVMTSISRTSTL